MLNRFFKAVDDADQRVLDQAIAPLEDWLSDCQLAAFDEPVSLGVLRSHWMAQLDSIGLQRRFAAGGVQFATLMPMRAIPFKTVCLLGMNDSAYPRSPTPRDFDLISHPGHQRPGDRARREDDRYLFLEALLSARERLYISWQGKRASDHAPLPASVLVAQLMDHLNQCAAQSHDDKPMYQARLQPLQPFSASYFRQGSGFATYAADWQAVNQLSRQTAADHRGLDNLELRLPPPAELTAQDLLTLLRQPLEVFFKHHLQVQLDLPQASDDENEPFALNGLHGYSLKQQVLYAADPELLLRRLKLQGELAMAGGGQAQSEQLLLLQAQIKAGFQPWQQDTDSDLPAQVFQLNAHGTVLNLPWGGDPLRWRLHADGSGLHMDMRAGKVGQGKDLRLHTLTVLWLGHLTANAAGTVTTSVLSGADGVVCMQPLPPQEAVVLLQDLVGLYRQAWASPLPLPLKTACAFVMEQQRAAAGAQARFARQRALGEARKAFQGMRHSPGECQTSPYVQRAFSGFDDMDLALFTALAERVYAPMLRVCTDALTQQEQAEA